MSESNPEFYFSIPPHNPRLSQVANAAISLAALSERLTNEPRLYCDHVDGRPENVAEHSYMLILVAPSIADEFYPKLDSGLVSRYAAVSDIVEAYVKDTPTHNYEEVDHTEKEAREKRGLEQFLREYHFLSGTVRLAISYHQQLVPEARFTYVFDKCMPLLQQNNNRGSVVGSYTDKSKMMSAQSKRQQELLLKYPEFDDIVKLRQELKEYIAKTYL